MRKTARAALLALLCLLLAGCRERTSLSRPPAPEDSGARAADTFGGSLPEDDPETGEEPDEQEKNGEPGGLTKENPEASRKEYDESRPAEILPGAGNTVHGSGKGGGLSGSGENADRTAAKLNGAAVKTASQTVPADEADRAGTSEEAEEADSAMTYYSVLLRERTASLFECQRLTVYWEQPEDHLTVHKTSPEHSLILEAGAYDVSARLLEENLHVDDGWIGRKNPGVVVKVVERNVLGTGVSSPDTARRVYASLLSRDGWLAMDAVRNRRVLLLSRELLETPRLRLAAMLLIAKTASPDRFSDVRVDDALAMLGEEAAGSAPDGIFYYTEQGGF